MACPSTPFRPKFKRDCCCAAIGCLFAVVFSTPALADSHGYENQISTVDERIQDTRDSIRSKESEKASLRRLLENYDKQIAAVKRQRQLLKKKIARLSETKSEEQSRGDKLKRGVRRRSDVLAKQLRAMYQAGRNPHLRTLLSMDDPTASARLIHYYKQVTEHQVADIESARIDLGKVMNAVTATAAQEAQVQHEQDALKAREAELAQLAKKRSRLLVKIESTLSAEQQRLSALESDRIKLQALVDELRQEQQAASEIASGRMAWPLVGQIKARYGEKKAQGTAKWAGLLIKALKGNPVVAVHEGEVVYAEWLRGFGLLIIVDHNNGMMSLYGNNDKLMYNVGETVLPGDVLATVGNSSSLNETGLYFELRQDGSPVDPISLLTRKIVAAKR